MGYWRVELVLNQDHSVARARLWWRESWARDWRAQGKPLNWEQFAQWPDQVLRMLLDHVARQERLELD